MKNPCWFICLWGLLYSVSVSANTRVYDFRVFLNDREIGEHRYEIRVEGAEDSTAKTYVTSAASFRVKFLFATLFRYRHNNKEVWLNGCLRHIEASTNNNGELLYVRGRYSDQTLSLDSSDGEYDVAGCVRTFAYWNPELLGSGELLNSQTGEMVRVTAEQLSGSSIDIQGELVPANRFRLHTNDFSIDLWYSYEQEWLALESTVNNGLRLRYLAK